MVLGEGGGPGLGLTGAGMSLRVVDLGGVGLSLGSSAGAGGFGVDRGDDLRDGLTTPIDDTASHERLTQPPETVADRDRSSSEQGPPPDTGPERETIRGSTDE